MIDLTYRGLRKKVGRHRERSVAIRLPSHRKWGFFARAQNDEYSFCVNPAIQIQFRFRDSLLTLRMTWVSDIIQSTKENK